MRIPKCSICGQLNCEGEEVLKEKTSKLCADEIIVIPTTCICDDCFKIYNQVSNYLKLREVKT